MVEFERGVLIGKIKTTCLRKTRPGSPVCCFGNWVLIDRAGFAALQKAFSQGNRFHTQTKIELESLLIYINQQFNRLFEPFKIHHSKFELTKSYLHKFDRVAQNYFICLSVVVEINFEILVRGTQWRKFLEDHQ